MINIKYSNYETITKRKQVRETFCKTSKNIKSGDIKGISILDLSLLFRLYDEVFLDDYFENTYKGTMNFSLSRRMTRSAGITVHKTYMREFKPEDYCFEIKMSLNFISDYHKVDREKRVSGMLTKDQLDALMIVFEHEICHVIECLCFFNTSCKGARFLQITNNIFGHTDVCHELPTITEKNQIKFGFKPGDYVAFECEGKTKAGFITRTNKRATVMVEAENGEYEFGNYPGKLYSKYYVPLNMLRYDASMMKFTESKQVTKFIEGQALTGSNDEASLNGKIKQVTQTSTKIGRNEPCPCGSGKKYKKCCGK